MASRRLLFVVNDTGFFVSHRLPVAFAAREAGFEVHLAALDTGGVETVGALASPITRSRWIGPGSIRCAIFGSCCS